MILKETILSAFTERGTLLKWLKKVEDALNNDILTDVSVDQISDTQIKLKFTFQSGDYIESPVITLPRGEKGEPGKDGLNGEGIAATIDVGTVTTGAPGTSASVTNVGTEQQAVLNFIIPRGEKGETGATGEAGPAGSAGIGFGDATRIEQNSGTNTLTAEANGLNIAATFKITAGNEVFEIPSSMFLSIKGSESIVIDVDQSGTFFNIHLDENIVSKLSRVLVTPMTAPQSVSIVGITPSNTQAIITIGEGLEIVNGVLRVKTAPSLSGTWQFNTDYNYDSNSLDYYPLRFSNNGNSYLAFVVDGDDYIDNADSRGIWYTTASDSNTVSKANSLRVTNRSGWINDAYRTIVIDGTQTVTEAFYTYFTSIATKVG